MAVEVALVAGGVCLPRRVVFFFDVVARGVVVFFGVVVRGDRARDLGAGCENNGPDDDVRPLSCFAGVLVVVVVLLRPPRLVDDDGTGLSFVCDFARLARPRVRGGVKGVTLRGGGGEGVAGDVTGGGCVARDRLRLSD